MQKRILVNVMLALLTIGLVFTVSCAKKTVDPGTSGVQSQSTTDTSAQDAAAAAAAQAEEEARRQAIIEQQMKDEAEKEAAMRKTQAARARFENIDIHFEYDSSELSPMARMLLREKAEWLEANPRVTVLIEGHCDERGTTEYNLALGERRALAAQNYMIDLGIAPSRLMTISYGEEKPIDWGHNEAAWAKNRRAHFTIN